MNLSEHADRLEAEWFESKPRRLEREAAELRRDLTRLVLLVDKAIRGMGE